MIISQLLKCLYSSGSPYLSYDIEYADNGYPHTHIDNELMIVLFSLIKPTYVVECGSMLGGSAIKISQALNGEHDVICIDPFTGDVNMWDWESAAEWKFLRLENGIPTIYKRFIANCKKAGLDDKILPINCTTIVGTKLLKRLYDQKRISCLPRHIYLDSAHEPDETLLELKTCWDLLGANSVLFGDDWSIFGVQQDVIKFSELTETQINFRNLNICHRILPNSKIYNNKILVYRDQWILFK